MKNLFPVPCDYSEEVEVPVFCDSIKKVEVPVPGDSIEKSGSTCIQ